MEYLGIVAIFAVVIFIAWLKMKAERAVARGINRAVQRKTVAKEKELTGEVIVARIGHTTPDAVLQAMRDVLPFKDDGLPVIGAALYVGGRGSEGFKIVYGSRLALGFEVAVWVANGAHETSEVNYTITRWQQVDGVAGATSMMESVRNSFLLAMSQMPGAIDVRRAKDNAESVLWAAVARPEPVAGPVETPAARTQAAVQEPVNEAVQTHAEPAMTPDAVDQEDVYATRLAARSTPVVTPVVTHASVQAPPMFWLSSADGAQRAVVGSMILGRSPRIFGAFPEAELWALEGDASSVSKSHAAVEATSQGLLVTDLKSTNGTQVIQDGKTRAVEGEPVLISHGELVLGEYRLLITAAA